MGLFVDLSKAFDTVDHDILLYKLSHYGIRGHANKFFKIYLNERKQFTFINNEISTTRVISCGVPQGSVLGPILFLIYVNDLSHAVGDEIAKLFADDTGLFTFGKNLNLLINESKIVYRRLFDWCICNRLSINFSKTCFVIFRARNKKVPSDLKSIEIDDISIQRTDVTKYLGLHIDEYLSWKHHVTQLCKNLMKYFGIFKKLRDSVPKQIARQLYYSFIYSRIDYGIQVYGSCSDTLLSKIQILSNKLVKYLLKLERRTPTNELHKDLKILKVKDIFEVNVLFFVKKCLSGECPTLFKDYFIFQGHGHNIRVPKLRIPSFNSNLYFNSVKVKGAVLWNKLDTNVKSKSFLKCFKKVLKGHYISKY